MNGYTFQATIIQTVDLVYYFATKKKRLPALLLEISFRNVYYSDYDAWDRQPDGDIVIDKLVDCMTQKPLRLQELTLVAQMDIRCHCFEYLRTNRLLRYPNLIPFQCLPYRYPSCSDDRSQTAELIDFPRD